MAGLSAFLAVVVGVTLWLTVRDAEYVAPTPSSPSARIQPAPAAARLQDLTTAVRRGDGEAAARLATPADPEAQAALQAFAENAQALRLRDVTIRYLDALGGLDGQGEWRAAATLQYRFPGDRTVAATEVEARFASSGGEVTISGLGGDHGAMPVWLAEQVQVRRTPETLVVAARDADAYSRMAAHAVSDVRRVVTGWQEPLVVEVVENGDALDAALGVDAGTFANIAGVTTPVPGADGSDGAVHVFLNRERLEVADPAGRQVVVSHEAAHAALGAAGVAGMPVWMGEGLADYIALRDVDLPLSVTAGGIIRQVRRAGVPDSLPGDDEFDNQSEHLGASYEASWLACRLLAERVGEDRLVRFYIDAERVSDFGSAFRRAFGLSVAELTVLWQRELRELAQ